MSNINLRLYADQFYGLVIYKINNYLLKPIEKESFISLFKSGILNYSNISTNKKIELSPFLSVDSVNINTLEINIPDEKGELYINIDGLKANALVSEISENKVNELIIKEKIDLKEKFINDIFNIIKNNSLKNNDFFGGIIFDSIGAKIINGLNISVKNIEFIIKFNNIEFTAIIEKIDFSLKDIVCNIGINGLKIYFKDILNNIEEKIIKNCDIGISIIFKDKKENNNYKTEFEVNINNAQIYLGIKPMNSIFQIFFIFQDIEQKKIDLRNQKLIKFHKPKLKDKLYYKLLWLYAIKSVIKLRKYICFDKSEIFEISNNSQNKLLNQSKNEDIILINDINLLKSTKQIVENKIIESKDSIANKFFSFFSSNTEDKSLNEEEKNKIEFYYKEENIMKYLQGILFNEENKVSSNKLVEKYGKYFNFFDSKVHINNIEISMINNIDIKDNIIKFDDINIDLKYGINIFDINFTLMDKTTKNKIFDFSYNNSNEITIILNKDIIEISDNILFLFICHSKFIIQNIITKRSIFNSNKTIYKNENSSINIKKINFPSFPSIILKIQNNKKIDINISNYSWIENLISFQIEIKDSLNTILENYKFDIDLSKGFNFNLEKPLIINVDKSIIEELITKFKIINNEFLLDKKNELKLYNFNFIRNISDIDIINNKIINITIKGFNIIINDKQYHSSILLNNMNILYENKNFSLNIKEMFTEIDLLSLSPLINDNKNIRFDFSFDYQINYKISLNNIIKSFKININAFKNYFYITHKDSYIYTIINNINVENKEQNIHLIKYSINDIITKYFDSNIPDVNEIILLDSKNIDVNLRIISSNSFVIKTNIDSANVSSAIILYNYNNIQKLMEYCLKLKNIYQININKLKCEYLKETENTDLSIYITNYIKTKENKDIDILNLEKHQLNYNLESYKDIIVDVYSKKLDIYIAQRDISNMFITLFSPENLENNAQEDIFSKFHSLSLDINLSKIRIDFNFGTNYDKPLFDIFLGNITMKLDVYETNIKNLKSSLNQLQINYYGNENDNILFFDKKRPIPILDYEINQDNIDNNYCQQIEVKKDIGHKYIANIIQIKFLFHADILLSIIYYFKDISIFDLVKNYQEKCIPKKDNKINDIDLQIMISEIQFVFPRKNKYLYLSLSKLDFNHIRERKRNNIEKQIKFSLNSIEAKFLKRKIISSKNDLFLFVLNIKDSENYSMICNSLLNKIFINVSYYDSIYFYQIFFDINKLFKVLNDEKANPINKENDNNINNEFELSSDSLPKVEKKINLEKKSFSITSEMNIEGIDIIFLEEDYNYIDSKLNHKYFYPYFKISFNKSLLKLNYEKNNNDIYPDIISNIDFDLDINYLNYDFKTWEPLTEELTIKIDYMNKNESNKLVDSYTLEINKLIFNLSDTFIIILLMKIFRYYNQFKSKNITYKLDENDISEKILKYKISNYTDIIFDMNYRNKNYKIKNYDKILIDFNEEENEEVNDNIDNYFIVKVENNDKKILLFPENFGIFKYKIKVNDIEKAFYIELKTKKHNHIEVNIYNSIIIKNSTNYLFKINFGENKEKIEIKSNSAKSFSEELLKNKAINYFLYSNTNTNIEEDNIKLNLEENIPKNIKDKLSKEISFPNKKIFFSLTSKKKNENLIFFNIQYKYCIINCLPCSLYISPFNNNNQNNPNDKDIEISKNSLYNIDDISLLTQSNSVILKIKIQNHYYTSKLSLMRNDTKTKLINFVSPSNDKMINLQIIIKESYKYKAMIIYSENILYNNSGLDLNIFTQDENNNNYIYDIGKNLYIISSEIRKSNSSFICIKSLKNIFINKYINYEDIKNKSISGITLNFEGKKDTYNFDIIIDKNSSGLYCDNDMNNIIYKLNKKDENKTIIYTLTPKYNIINLSSDYINKSINLLLKSSKKYLMGINIKNIEDIREKNNYYVFDNVSLNSFYTICFKGNMYNIEIKKADKGGYKNIFITNYNNKNSQIMVENKTNFELFIKQKTFEKLKQSIKKNEKQILKIYDQANKNFSVEIDNKLYYFNLNETREKQLKKNLYLYIEKEKVVKKIIFYIKKYNEDPLPKSKSLMNLNQPDYHTLKYNFNRDKLIKLNILINHINISLISQNKKEQNNSIERNEIVLLFINDFKSGIKLMTSKTNTKYKMKLNIKISNIEVYNLLNNTTTCLCMNTSGPLMNFYSELTYELEKNKIIIFELVNEMGNIKLNITPTFLQEIYNFVLNTFENDKIFTKDINKIFLINGHDNLNLYKNKSIFFYNNNIPLSIVINKIILSGIKIRFKLKKEGIESLPNAILDSINYFKCFPFFDIGKETKAIISKIELQGPFKDINTVLEKIKSNIITQLSTEFVIKVLHPSNNDIKENMKNMIGFDSSKSNHKINSEISSRIKYKRIFLGKNKIFNNFDKIISKFTYKIKNLGEFDNKYFIDSFCNFNNENNVILFFDNLFILEYDNGQNITMIKYENLKEIKYEKINKKFFVSFKYKKGDNNENEQVIKIEFKNESIAQKIYKILYNFSNI